MLKPNQEHRTMTLKVKQPAECKVCGSSHLTWQSTIVNRSDVQQGRLNTRDVECLFMLGCDECSETLMTLSADKVAGLMNASATLSAAPQFTPSHIYAAGVLVHQSTD
jgi:hypothetical protein